MHSPQEGYAVPRPTFFAFLPFTLAIIGIMCYNNIIPRDTEII